MVDDNATNRKIVVRHATSWDMEAIEAASGRQALDVLHGPGAFDVVVVDHLMPGMDGVELAREIRRMPGRGGLPMILLSSLGTTDSGEEAAPGPASQRACRNRSSPRPSALH